MIAHRPMEPEDRTFVIDAWIRSFRTSNHAGLISMDTWRSVMWPEIEALLERPSVRTIVAHDPDADESVALCGFIAFDVTTWSTPMVFYVYTKQAYRRGGNGRLWQGPGLARQLFAAAAIDPARPFLYACKTAVLADRPSDGDELEEPGLQRKIPLARWAPILARFPKERS